MDEPGSTARSAPDAFCWARQALHSWRRESATVVDLEETIRSVRERIERYRGQSIGEQNTKNVLIEPVLRALGWDVEDLDEVRREYRRKAPDSPVDYVLFLLRTPRLFVEAKALGENLGDDRWAKQIMGYAAVAGVEWVVLTDGNEYRIYNSHATVPVEEKLFRRVVIASDTPSALATLRLLSKSQLQENQIEILWRADFVDRQVRSVLESLLIPEPPADFVRLLRRRLPALLPGDIRASLARARVAIDYPVVQLPAVAVAQVTEAARQRPIERQAAPSDQAKTPWRRVSLADLIAAGRVRPPMVIETPYKGKQLTAQIDVGGTVTFDGVAYDSLSTAGGIARRSVIGAPPGREYPQTNGWTFWRYRRSDGSLGLLDELRQKHWEQKVVRLDEARSRGA